MSFIKTCLTAKRKRWMALYGLLLGLAAPGFGAWMLAWLALIPALLWVNRQTSLKSVFAGGFGLGFVFQGLFCLWFFDLHPLTWLGFSNLESRLITLAGWLIIAVEGGLLCGLLMLIYARLKPGWPRVFLFPLLWVFAFSMLNWTPMALPWGLLEYTQAPLAPMRWLAMLITASGVAYAVVCHNALWANLFAKADDIPAWKVFTPALCPLGIWALSVGLPTPHPQQWIKPLAVIQANLPIELIRSSRLNLNIIEPAYLEPLETSAFPPGTLVAYPEEGVVPGIVYQEEPLENPILARLQALSEQKHISIAVGVSVLDLSNQFYNGMALLNPNHQPVQFYFKRRLVPFGEFTPYGLGPGLKALLNQVNVAYSAPFEPGKTSPLLQAGNIRLGGLMCFDLIDFDPLNGGFSGQYQRQGAQLLVNASNLGWFHQNPFIEAQFLAIGQMRAAENRLPLVIASNTGISAILSSQGDVLARTMPYQMSKSQHKTQIIFYNGK